MDLTAIRCEGVGSQDRILVKSVFSSYKTAMLLFYIMQRMIMRSLHNVHDETNAHGAGHA
jgi:hypothetical protein